MKINTAFIQRMYSQIENLLSATENKQWGKIMKYLLCGLTSTEEIKKVLNECIDNSPYDHKTLACKLSKLYPLEGWTERSIGYMLRKVEENGSQSTDTAKVNQIMEFLYPDEKFDFTVDSFYERIELIHERLSNIRAEFSKAVKTDKTVDEKESKLILANINILSHMIDKFEEATLKAVNVTLG